MKAGQRTGYLALAVALTTALAACAELPFAWQEAAQDWLASLCDENDRCDRWGDGAVFY